MFDYPIPPLPYGATPEQKRRYSELIAQSDRNTQFQFWFVVGSFGLMLIGIAVFAVLQAWFA